MQCGLHDMAPETALDQCGVTSKQLVGLYECLTKAGRQVPAPLDLMLYTLKELKEMEIPARAEGDADVGPCVAVPFLEMQESYVLGRRTPALGPCQIYTEVLFKDIDLQALQAAVQRVAQAEPMLRATCQASGQMQEIREDLHWQLEVEEDSSLARARWSRPLPEGRFWALGASRCSGQVQLHLKVDMTFLDAESWLIVCCKVATGYRPTTSLPPSPDPSHEFFRYCATQQRGGLGEVEWKEKLKDLPLGPALPWCSRMGQGQAYAFGRVPLCVLREQWEDLKQHAKELGVSCTQLLITYFQDAIAFSSDASFTLTATVSRRPNHLKGCLGEFTNVALLSCNAESLQQERGVRAKNIQQQLLTQLAPGHITGMQIMRLWREIRREEVVLPVVLTSLLDLEHAQPISFGEERATVVYQRTQTPAVRLDVQFFEVQNELCVNFDYDERWLSEDVVKQLAKSFEEALAGEKLSVLHGGRLDTQAYNHSLLHELAFADLDAKKDLPALRSPQHTLSYDDLDRVTNYLANELTMIWNNQGVRSNFCDVRVAVALEKGWEQVVACLGVLRSGACYVPLELSDCRWKKVLSSADCSLALIKEGCDVRQETDTKCQCLEIGEVWLERARTAECKHIQAQPRGCDAAYIIFTSGTTGEPKGVVISHKSACNTCISVSHLLKLTKDDRVLALSNLNFDLSVYDIFGTLAAGACIVMCKQDDLKRYLNLCKVVSKEHVTIWNSVPLRFQLLVDEWCDSYFMPIRAALISGDAIQTSFARKVKRRFPALQFLALGGATEASIWSNFHEFTEASPDLPLVLYGKPLTNQQMYVLDSQMRIRPAYVPGEIFIGGSGVAKEYFRDQQRTAKSFLEHREYGRLYKTGDMGCYLPSGEIQIMGRLDQQVKVDGYRVELAEIEAAAHEILPKQVRVIVAAEKGQGVILRGFLCGQCPELNMAELKQMLQDGLKERLPIYMRPRTWSTAQNLPQGANGKVDRQKLLESRAPEAQFASAVHVASAEELLRITQGVLSNPDLAMDADLAEAGMNSLRARDLHIAILKAFGVNVPSYAVFDHFTVRALARAFLNPAGAGGVESPVLEALPSLQPKRQRSVVQGVGMCLPGGFFELHQGINCVTTVPLLRFDVDEYFSPDMEIGKTYTRHGSFIPSLGWFDSDAFPLSEHEVAAMDPQQRLALQVAAMAMGPQATGPSRGSVGVYAGQMDYDWMVSSKAPAPYGSTGVAPSITANRISFVFDLRGPSMTIDTACSASLTAAHQAMQAMNDGPGAALVVGTHVLLAPDMYLHACKAKMLSPKGRCATFDQSADGFVRGEGVASMFLVLDPDIALCQVLGTASNQNGRSAGLTKPKSDAQKVVIGEGLRRAGVDGCAVLVHELHGTGTRLGDPLEAEAVRAMLGESLVLQALKTHFGHLEGAAGIAGLMKQVALLQSLAATPNLHLYKLNDEVALAKDAKHVLEVVDLSATSPWTCAASRYVASVSSFGFGGSNAFAVLEAMQPVEAGKKAWKDLSTAAAALRSGPKKYFALIEHDVQRTKWMELKDGLCRVTAQLCTYKPSMGQADLATAKDNARLLAVACWPSEQQQTSLQIIERCSAFVLKTLQKAGEEPGAWRLLVAGRGQAAEACFAAAASMLRSAQGEQELRVQVVHLPASSWAEVEAALAEHSGLKLPPVSEEPVCRVRPEGVLVPRLERWRPDRQPGVSVRLGGRYVITGGSGALARVCAEWLLGRGAAAVTLLSRSCPGYLEHDRRLHWLRCDVSVAGELRNAIQAIREKGKVHGVMHAAGVLADAMLVNQSEELLRRAFGPKILPALLLPELEPSDWLVMFSSAAVLGSPGQCAYAAANAAMDGLVSASDSGSGARMLSVQWGPWTEGMATQVKGALARAAERGWAPLPRNMGLAILELLLDSGATGVLCAVHRSEEVPAAAPAPKVLQSKTFSDLDVLSIVRAHVAELVSKRSCGGPLQELGDSAPILEGLESLETEELHAALQKTFNIRLLQGTVINHPTIKQLAHCIGDSLRNDTDLNLKSTAADGPMTWAELPGAPDRKGCLTLFLIGGAAGDVRKSFGEFASFYPGRVFAAMPPRRRGVSMKDILEELGPSLGTRSGGQPFMLGGLSFGATVALELLRVRYAKGALGIIVFDPRNLPPYSTAALPRDPLWYETLCSRMEAPKLPIPGIHILARLGSYHGDGFKAPAAEGFQNDEEVRERVRCIFPHGLSTVPVDADHFEFLSDSHAKALAQHLGQLAMHGPKLLEADLRPPPKISLEVACMACDLPSARGASALLVDAVTQIPFSRMDLESSQIYTKHGACMAEVEWFDHQHFGIKAAEAWVMDPQQRLLLQQACMVLQACEKETGVWIGQANHDWLSLRGWEACPFSAGGSSPAISANRVNYVFNLLGPSASVDTACSSSLVAFSQARNALDLEKCSRALVGGTHVFADPGMFRAACSTKALSQSGRCRTLDASADGYCRGEGVAALVLQPAAGDAGVAAAAVPATATNHNGRSASLTAPSGPAQQELMREALRVASAKGADVGCVELHGTGTKLGDPIEAQSTLAVFSRSEQSAINSACLVLGAVKTNMGHLEGSAGMAGLFKLMTTLRRRVAMPNLHIRQLNAHLRELNDSSLFPDALMACRAQLGAVSSFGFGGSNAQVLLQQLEADPRSAFNAPVLGAKVFLPWRRLLCPPLARQDGSVFRLQQCRDLFVDHSIGGDVLLPATCLLTMLAGAWVEINGFQGGVCLEGLRFLRPTKISDDSVVMIRFVAALPGQASAVVECGGESTAEARAVGCQPMPDRPDINNVDCACHVDLQSFYAELEGKGVRMGPRFRVLEDVRRGSGAAAAKLQLPPCAEPWEYALRLPHWSLLDGAIQLLGVLCHDRAGVCLPFTLERCWLSEVPLSNQQLRAYAKVTIVREGLLEGNVTVATEAGRAVAFFEGIVARTLNSPQQISLDRDLYKASWLRCAAVASGSSSLQLLDSDDARFRHGVGDGLRLLALQCWNQESAEEDAAVLIQCAAKILETLQQAAMEQRQPGVSNPGAWRLLIAGSGQLAEASFGAAVGMLRSAQCEQDLHVQVVHLPASSWAEVEAALAEHSDLKLPPVSDEPVCRVSQESILVPRLERWRPDRQPGVSVRLDGRYVITGGSGSLARVCAEWLLGRGAASVTLLSRSCPGYLEDDRRLHWLRCDVSVAGELRSAIQAIRDKGEVHGVMHAAGVLADAMLANQSKELLRRAFGPKILPALLLPELEPSDWLVMFSSAAVLGSPGQCAYAAANAAMDGLVSASDSGSGARMLSVQWGPWSEVGMAANHDLLSRVERHGFGSFTNSQGIDVLDCLLAQAAQGPLCAARVNWNAFSWPGHPVMMSHIHIRIGHPLPNLPQGAVKMKMQRPDALALLQRLATDMLGHELDPNQPLMDAGVDSLLAVELANRVSKEIGAKLPSTWLFDFPTLGSMADQLAQQAGAHVRGAAPPNLPVATPRAAMVVAGACCQLPGVSIADVLCGGRDCVVEVPTLRMDLDSWYGPEAGSAGMSYTQHAACMDGVEWFDATYFKISIPEASAMDPQQRLLLQAAACAGCEAVEKSAAVVVGQANHDWPLQNHPGTPFIGTGLSPAITSNRISFHFQLKGLSMTVDTACSSSLVALVVAQSRSDAALVGATHVMMSALPFIGSCAAGMLSQSGRCRTLDSSADGYCRGEGVAALVLQRAARDAGVAAAAVPATATNHNGRSASLTAPSGPAQQELMREALRMASAKGADVGFVELHGTGTKLGDPIEAQSTLAVFSRSEQSAINSACLVLGAVKTNMGHLEGSAGMAGLFKLMTTLRRRVAMPNLHIRQLNAHLRELNDSSLFPDALMACRAQLGAVSSFGFGGSNAQVLLQQLEADPQAARVQTPPTVCWHGRQGAFFDIPGTPSVLHTTRWQSAPCAAASVPIMLASKQVFRGMAREWSADGVRLLAMKCWDREIAEEAEGDQQQTSLQIIERCSAFVLKTLQKAGEEPGAWRLLVAGRGQAAEACFAAAASMLRSAQGEQELRVQVVHLPASSWAEVEAALAEHSDLKLPPVSDEPVCRVSPESILVPRLERWRPDRQPGVSVRLDGRYVITGGSGSLARVCAEWLLSRGATSVTLLSRSCPGYLEDDRRLHWLRCDVSVAGELRSAIQAIRDKGEVHGVMHAAGVLADAMLANQSEELLRRAFGPKILPALLLPELEPSDWLVMFSSAAVLGSPGQCAYAAANAAMDGLVSASDSGSGARMLSVQWGPWSEVGMAASQDVLGRAERHGFGAFTNRQGIDVLDHLLSHGALGCVCAARGDLAHVPSASAKAPDNRGPTPELGVLIRRLVAELTSQEETEVSVDAELVDIGLDSLGAANLSQGLSKELGVKVLPTLASEASTVRDLEQVLARELAAVPLMGDFEAATSKLPTLVVGAGVGGVIFAQQLHMARENVIVMEKGDQPGGSWHLGNSSSRLQIDSPSYMLNYEQQFNLPAYPSKEQILTEVRNAAKVLPDVRLGHRVTSVKTLQRGQYQVSFMNQLEEEQSMTVGGVAFFLGGLHHPRNVNYPGEERFTGKIGLGHKDDVDPGFFKDKEVVIVGHGAFAVENMRTALQQGAKRVTMVARRRNVVFPTVVNWLINSVHSTLSIREIRPILASFYQSVGLTLDDLPALKEDSIDFRIPPCSDIYFLAQAMGKLKVVIGEVKRVKEGAVVVQEGDTQQVIECTRLLKCIGFLHAPCVEQILGRPLEQVASFWIDGDVNLVANDQFQVPERVSSLLCPSYSFYVHSFANAFLSYRKNPQALEALSKSTNLSPHDAVTVMWQHFKAMKEKVARLTSEHLPFWRFVAQRREEWQSNAQLLNPDFQGVPNLDDLLRPASSKAAQLWPYEPQDVAGVLAPARRPRVLFFHGQKTDRLVAIELLKAQGWWQQNLDFVIPDGPHVVEADADPEQLQRVGLTQLVASKKYRPGAAYKEWPSNFQMFFDLHMGNMSKTEIERAAEAESRRYSEAFHYLKEVSTRFGPFDGVAGFCQGAAFAQVALCQQRAGHDLGLQDVRMMIAMAPWRCPYHEHLERVGQFDSKLEMPLLLMHGRQDLDMFKEAIPAFSKSFREARVVAFEGAHAYPPLARSPDLRAEVQRFLNESQRRF
ncbi:unnamed protein product [Effrenium voratum]|uniref:Uncharacterized protein n=1 Tax=Effrenium voratum TaxID=2562239 RepID=A0AA36HXQ2_9DINO|nr:unnamed protein product [Effrenium voratum]